MLNQETESKMQDKSLDALTIFMSMQVGQMFERGLDDVDSLILAAMCFILPIQFNFIQLINSNSESTNKLLRNASFFCLFVFWGKQWLPGLMDQRHIKTDGGFENEP